MAIVYRLVKGAPLTITELDDNFHDLDDRVVFIEENPPEARSIESIEQPTSGDVFYINYTDDTQDGPFVLPTVALNYRGEWVASTVYVVNDIITANGNVYLVIFNHTSELTFDAGANDGEGHDFYGLLLETPELSTPAGGGPGYVLSKITVDDFDTEWANRGIPDGGATGDVLTKTSNEDLEFDWADPGAVGVPAVLVISIATLTIDDPSYSNTYFRCTNISGCAVTILPDDEIAFSTATELHFRQCSVNPVSIIAGSSTAGTVTLNVPTGYETETAVEGAVITVKKVAANEWDVFGLLAASSA